jgi:hypothetical protein
MKHRIIGLCIVLGAASASFGQTVLYDKMTGASNGIITSSWWDPNGSDYDTYTWDDFQFNSVSTINEVRWRGGNSTTGPGGISGFTIRFYESIAGGSQPKITALPESETAADYLKGFNVSGTANETAVPGTSLFEYSYSLSTPLTLQANTKYWVKICADMNTFPFWGMATSTSNLGDGKCFRYFTGGPYFLNGSGDTAFQLRGSSTVPEPGAFAALGIGAGLLIRRKALKKRV